MFKATRAAMAMQPTRSLMMRGSQRLYMRQSPQLFMRQTLQLRMPVPKEEQGAHTISQRVRQLKNIPTEIWPVIIVVAIAVFAAVFSLIRKLMIDPTLRLKRQGKNH